MSEPDPSQPRVNCPRCAKRFRVELERVRKSPDGAPVRCSGCLTTFRLTLGASGDIVIQEDGESPGRATAPAGKSRPPAVRRGRKRSSRHAARSKASPAGASQGPEAAKPEPGLGERIGRYEVESLLGRGGMAAVYRAFDPAANRHVALKVLSSDAPADDQARFQREVQVQGNIQHPHIMPIFDSGSIGRSRHFAMELLKDPVSLTSLGALARQGQAVRDPHLRPAATLEGMLRHIMLPVCEAVHHANVREGVIHRDLKPDNILIDRNGLRPFVIDFGICSVIERKNTRLAHLPRETPGRLVGGGVRVTGTLVYMPPEQARGVVDRRGDVWAIGAILHFLLTGSAPLAPASKSNVSAEQRIEGLKLLLEQAGREGQSREAAGFRRKLHDVESGRERTLEDLQRDVLAASYLPLPARAPKGLAAIVHKAMAREPEDRYRHALDLQRDLEAWMEGRPVRAQIEQTNPFLRPLYQGRVFLRRHGWALLLLLLAGLGGAWAALGRGGGGEARVDDASVWLERAETALDGGRVSEARAALDQAIGEDEATRRARDLLARLDQEVELTRAIERGEALAADMEAAFGAGRVDDALAALAALRETLASRVEPCVDTATPGPLCDSIRALHELASGQRALTFTRPVDTVEVVPVDAASRVARFDDARSLSTADALLPYGAYLLHVARAGGELWLPCDVPPGRGPVEITLALDPARVPAAFAYVPAGRGVGPVGEADVPALLWDRTEVSCARYARFLASLSPEDRRRRVPRQTGPLGASGRPLWAFRGDAVVAPGDAARRPVEGISYQDAKAFAAFEGARLPTAAEWAWAATGGDGRATPVGSLEAVLARKLNLAGREGATDIGHTLADRSPFGLLDMTGNLSELTSTLATCRGENGWLVMGGSYRSSPAAALVGEAEPVPGWEPRPGVGLRLVRGLDALSPAEDPLQQD